RSSDLIREWYSRDSVMELTSFASWQLFGTLCALGRNQGVAVVLNLFYSTVVNAAYGIANQINGQIMFFSQTMMSAVRPQIMKSEGANDRQKMIMLSIAANKFAFFLFTFFALPLYFQMPAVLSLWLKDVPNYSIEFCRAIILLTAMNQINMGLMTAVQAIGKIKVYQIIAGGIQLMALPVGFVFLKYGYPPYSIILVSFVLEAISTVFRMFYFRYLTGYPVVKYLKNVILVAFIPILPAICLISVLSGYIGQDILSIFITLLCSSVIYGISIYAIGLNKGEKLYVRNLILKVKTKLSM